ncbi:MAG: sirohydrochlorin chelatase [Nodosilinea sp. LVE1205-7]
MSTTARPSIAYLLVFHGSRDPRPAQAMERLSQFVRSQIAPFCPASGAALSQDARPTPAFEPEPSQSRLPRLAPGSLVGIASLDASTFPLHEQIVHFGRRAQAMGVETLLVIPLFLGQGTHVMEDIPAALCMAQRELPALALNLTPHLGVHPGLQTLLHRRLETTSSHSWILLAHGSRRRASNAAIETLAKSLGGTAAYWSHAPSLETRIIQLLQSGVQQLAIFPYFLFTGTTTDAIIRTTEALAERFPQVRIHLLPPLGPTADLAQLVIDLALNQMPPIPQPRVKPLQRIAFSQAV